jgi:hypothetical protein
MKLQAGHHREGERLEDWPWTGSYLALRRIECGKLLPDKLSKYSCKSVHPILAQLWRTIARFIHSIKNQ